MTWANRRRASYSPLGDKSLIDKLHFHVIFKIGTQSNFFKHKIKIRRYVGQDIHSNTMASKTES